MTLSTSSTPITAPTIDRQIELGDQPIGEWLLVQPNDTDRKHTTPYGDRRTGWNVDRPPAVAGQQRERRVRLDVDPNRRRRRRHQRPAEQGVRADRHQPQRLDL